jgi:hypothetical protein
VEVSPSRSLLQELDFACQRSKFGFVSTRSSIAANTKIGPGTIAAALAALSMAVLTHFFI